MNKIVNISIGDIISDAQKSLSGNWGTILGAFALYFIVSLVAGLIPFVSFVIGGPLSLGLAFITLGIVRNKEVNVSMLFDGFNNFGSALGLLVLTTIVILIGFLLFIIPGIILAIGLSQVFYILADNPNMSVVDIMKKSFEMMKGYKTKWFVMQLVFGLMILACIFTLGLGLFWVVPVITVGASKFYTLINAEEGDGLSIEDNLID